MINTIKRSKQSGTETDKGNFVGLALKGLIMENFHFKKLLITRKSFTVRKKWEELRRILKNSGKLWNLQVLSSPK